VRDYGGQVAHGVKSSERRKEVGSSRFEVEGGHVKRIAHGVEVPKEGKRIKMKRLRLEAISINMLEVKGSRLEAKLKNYSLPQTSSDLPARPTYARRSAGFA
jgi:hypothetical protein